MQNLSNLSGQKLGQFELRSLIGMGGMGAVYRGYQPSLDRDVAIKVLSPELTEDGQYIERFNREALVVARLEHAHIVPIHEYGTVDNISYVVMRLLTGGSLQDRLKYLQQNEMTLPSVDEVISVLRQLAGALDYAHQHHIIHRDIKPSNVMFDSVGTAFLVDFGIARILDQSATRFTSAGIAVGTAQYMAPEQFRDEQPTPAIDQYAMGIMTFSLLTGNAPYEASNLAAYALKHVQDPIPKVSEVLPELGTEVDAVFEMVLAKRPEDRYESVTAFVDALEYALLSRPDGATSPPTNFFKMPLPGLRNAQPTPSSQRVIPRDSSSQVSAPTLVDLPSTNELTSTHSRKGGMIIISAVIVLMVMVAGVIGFAVAESQQEPPRGLLVAMGMVPGWTETPTETATLTATVTPTQTPVPAVVDVPTATDIPAATATETPMATTSPTATVTATSTATSTATTTETETETPPATETSSPTGTATHTATITSELSSTPVPTETFTATVDLMATETAQAALLATQQAMITPSAMATLTWTPTPQPTETATSTQPVATLDATPTFVTSTPAGELSFVEETATAIAVSTASRQPTVNHTPTATATITLHQTAMPTPTEPQPATPVNTSESVSIDNLPFEVPYLDGRDMGIQLDWIVTEDEWYQLIQSILPLDITWVKLQIDWSFIVPEQSSELSSRFRALELYIDRLERNGFKVLLSVAKAPLWLRPDGAGEDGPPTNPQEYADFLSLMLQGFGDSITAIEIWNEPNLVREWTGGLEFSGAGYMRLFEPAYNAIRAYSPDIAIITAGLAPTGIVPGETIPDGDYLLQMYAAGLGNYNDIYIGGHPFGWSNPADATCCSNSAQGFDDNKEFFFLNNLDDIYAIMQQNGDGGLQIWVTEFGWATWEGLPQPAPTTWMDNNSALEQAQYTLNAFQIGQQRPEVGPMILWNLNFANSILIDSRNEIAGYSLFVPGIPIRPLYDILAAIPESVAEVDLSIVDWSTSPPTPSCLQTATTSITVANSGSSPSTQTTVVLQDLHSGNEQVISSATIPVLQPGQNVTVQITLTVSTFFGESHRYLATIDPDNAVAELHEDNNTRQFDYILRQGDCQTSISIPTPTQPNAFTTVPSMNLSTIEETATAIVVVPSLTVTVSAPAPTHVVIEPNLITATTLQNANIRSGPGISESIVGSVLSDETYRVLARNLESNPERAWFLIEASNQLGWIAGWLVNIDGDINDLPNETQILLTLEPQNSLVAVGNATTTILSTTKIETLTATSTSALPLTTTLTPTASATNTPIASATNTPIATVETTKEVTEQITHVAAQEIMDEEVTYYGAISFSYAKDWTLTEGTDLVRLTKEDATIIIASPANYAYVLGTHEFAGDADALAFFLDRSGYDVGDLIETDVLAGVEVAMPRRNQSGTATLVDVNNDQVAVIIELSEGETDTNTLTSIIIESLVVPSSGIPEVVAVEEPVWEETEEAIEESVAKTATATFTATPTIQAVINSSANLVNVRNGPGTSFGVIETISPGSNVSLIEVSSDGDWYNIQLDDGQEGWIAASLVRVVPTMTPSPDAIFSNSQNSIVDVVVSYEELSFTVAAIAAVDLTGILTQDGPYAIFVPTNDAWANYLTREEFNAERLFSDAELLRDILLYHVSTETLDMLDGSVIEMANGEIVYVSVVNDEIILNGLVNIIESNITASNGIIYVIDDVLVSSNLESTFEESTDTLRALCQVYVAHEDGIRLREEPTISSSVVYLLPQSSVVEVLQTISDERNFVWFQVRTQYLDGHIYRGWVREDTVEYLTDCSNVSRVSGSTETAAIPDAETQDMPSNSIDVFAFCDDSGYGISTPVIPSGSSIEIYWPWFARTEQQVQDYVDFANHTIRVNRQEIPIPDHYVMPIRQQGAFYVAYYYVPYGPLEPGEYEILYEVTWDHAINDGDAQYGPGTNIPFQTEKCTFVVE